MTRAAHIFIRNKTGIFLQLRDLKIGIYNPGTLGAFGGRIEDYDATPLDGALRELREETLIVADNMKRLGVTQYAENDESFAEEIYAFEITVDKDNLRVYEGQRAVHVPFGVNLSSIAHPIAPSTYKELQEYYPDEFAFG